jgi:hypothetical protein
MRPRGKERGKMRYIACKKERSKWTGIALWEADGVTLAQAEHAFWMHGIKHGNILFNEEQGNYRGRSGDFRVVPSTPEEVARHANEETAKRYDAWAAEAEQEGRTEDATYHKKTAAAYRAGGLFVKVQK